MAIPKISFGHWFDDLTARELAEIIQEECAPCKDIAAGLISVKHCRYSFVEEATP